MDIFNSDFLKQQWEAFVTAPYIILPPVAIAAWAGWWLKGKLSEERIADLKERLEWVKDAKAEVESQFKDYKDKVGNSHAAQAAKVDAAIADLNNAVSPAVNFVKNEDYFRGVLKNMDRCAKDAAVPKEIVFVRFGTVGKGVHPNYQVETPKGTTRFAGVNHEPFHLEPNRSFNEANLSKRFDFGNIQAKLR